MNIESSGELLVAAKGNFHLEMVGAIAFAKDIGCKFEKVNDLFVFKFAGKTPSRRIFRKRCKDLAWR